VGGKISAFLHEKPDGPEGWNGGKYTRIFCRKEDVLLHVTSHDPQGHKIEALEEFRIEPEFHRRSAVTTWPIFEDLRERPDEAHLDWKWTHGERKKRAVIRGWVEHSISLPQLLRR